MYNIQNWYWIVNGSTPIVYSSASNSCVATTDETYSAWVAAGGVATVVSSFQAALSVVIQQKGLLEFSDITMARISEAIALGENTWTASDVVAFVNWRRALRAIISGADTQSTSIPAKPSYPSGT